MLGVENDLNRPRPRICRSVGDKRRPIAQSMRLFNSLKRAGCSADGHNDRGDISTVVLRKIASQLYQTSDHFDKNCSHVEHF